MARGRKPLPPGEKVEFQRVSITLHPEKDRDIIEFLAEMDRFEKSAWMRRAFRARMNNGVLVKEVVKEVEVERIVEVPVEVVKYVEVPVEVEVAEADGQRESAPVDDFDEWEF